MSPSANNQGVDNLPATSATLDPLAALDELARRPVAMAEEDLAFPAALAGDTEQPLGEVDRVLASTTPAPLPQAKLAGAAPAQNKPAGAAAGADTAKTHAEVTEPEQKAAQPEKKEAPKFTLQLSSFQDRAEADAFHDKLREAGHAPSIAQSEVDGQTWFRVRLGRYPSYDAAIAAKSEFEKREHVIAYVTRL